MSTIQKLAKMGAKQKQELLASLRDREVTRCAESLSYFAFTYVKTRDEHDFKSPIKPLPRKRYLEILFHEMQYGPPIQYIAKSRQLMVSWALCTYAVWTAQFHPHSRVCFQSKKQEDAAEMIYDTSPTVARCSLIMLGLPEWLKICIAVGEDGGRIKLPFTLDQKVFSYGSIKLPNGSRADALAQGAAQVESKVPTLFLGDEASLQDEWMSSQAAVTPCILGGGRGVTVGTMRLPSDFGAEVATAANVDPDGLARGIARFESASGVPGLRIHYSADPDKDPATEAGREWFKTAVAAMPGGYDGHLWQQHMEINPQSRSGTRCIPQWDKIESRIKVKPIPLDDQRGWVYAAGLDWGVRNPAVWLVLGIAPDRKKYLVECISRPGRDVGGVPGFCALIRQSPYLDRLSGTTYADPTIWKEDQSDHATFGTRSIAAIFESNGMSLRPAALNGQAADEIGLQRIVYEWWGQWEEEDFDPEFLIFDTCTPVLTKWPQMRYEDPKGVAPVGEASLKERMLDNGKVDEWDAFKYLLVSSLPTSQTVNIPPPVGSYAWVRQQCAQAAQAAKRRKRG